MMRLARPCFFARPDGCGSGRATPMLRAFAYEVTCASSWRKHRPSSVLRGRPPSSSLKSVSKKEIRSEAYERASKIVHPKQPLLSTEVEGFDSLSELALDMRSSWNHATDQVWRELDPVLWELTHNPWVVLQTVSREKLQRVLADGAFRKNVDDLVPSQAGCCGGPFLVSANIPPISAELCCVFQYGIHVERSVADLLGRAGQCGR